MLEDKLNAARQARRQHTLKLVASVAGILVVCAVVLVFSTSCCDFSSRDVSEVESEFAQATPSPETVVDVTADNNAARQQYLDAMNRYQTELEPELAKTDLVRWQPEPASRLTVLKDAALNAFAAANYSSALNQLQQAATLAKDLINSASEQFSQNIAAAQVAYDRDDYDNARLQIDRAQMLDSESEYTKQLAGNIAALGEILPLLKLADVARVENKPENELRLVEEILALAPEREKQHARRKELLSRLGLQRYQSLIANAYAEIDKGDAVAAEKHINNAKQLYPNRGEVKDASAALQALQQQQRFERHASLAIGAMRADEWPRAKQELTLALNEKPGDKKLADLLKQTDTILALQAQMEQHLANPYRLADASINASASKVLTEASPFRETSLKLDRTATALGSLINNMNRKIDVTVRSDNKTSVLVRGVGIVGVTESKTIQLKPGEYKFEGKRDGYKSKLIDVLVPYDKNNLQLTVVCDEPI